MIIIRKQKQFGFLNVMGAFGKGGNFAKSLGKSGLGFKERLVEGAKGLGKVGVAAAVPVGVAATPFAISSASALNGGMGGSNDSGY